LPDLFRHHLSCHIYPPKKRARGRRRHLAASSVEDQPTAAVESNPRERESVCDDERGGAVTKCVAAAGGASLFAVAEEGKEELLPSRQSPSCFLVADEGAARTVAVAEEGDAREGAVSVVAVAAVEKSKFCGFDKEGNRWKERTAGTVKFPKNKVTSKNKIIAECGSLAISTPNH
ncbi:hypothetical protein S83_071532, partial [Arachis hypogaea]